MRQIVKRADNCRTLTMWQTFPKSFIYRKQCSVLDESYRVSYSVIPHYRCINCGTKLKSSQSQHTAIKSLSQDLDLGSLLLKPAVNNSEKLLG